MKVNTFSTVERTFGGYGEVTSGLAMPCQVAIGPHDDVFVSDKGRIAVYDNFGSYLMSIGVGVLHDPRGIGVSDDKVGICDSDTLYFFNFDGELISRFSTNDVLGAKINHFNDVSISGEKVYILTDKNVIAAKSNF
jgi:hypothetical protein